MAGLGLLGENKTFNRHTQPQCTCLAFLASHSTKRSAYPRSPPHQRALITGAITHAEINLGEGRKEPEGREGGGRARGGEGEQPHSYCIQKHHSQQINSSYYLPHLARPWTRPGRNTIHSLAVAREQHAKRYPVFISARVIEKSGPKSQMFINHWEAWHKIWVSVFFVTAFVFQSRKGTKERSPLLQGHPGVMLVLVERNIVSGGGEVRRLHHWRLRSDEGLFSWAGLRPKTSSAASSVSARCWPDSSARRTAVRWTASFIQLVFIYMFRSHTLAHELPIRHFSRTALDHPACPEGTFAIHRASSKPWASSVTCMHSNNSNLFFVVSSTVPTFTIEG